MASSESTERAPLTVNDGSIQAPVPAKRISVPDLPEDVFLLLLVYLDLWDIVRFRRVSKSWQIGFSHSLYLQVKLRAYPRARELRQIASIDSKPTGEVETTRWQHIFDNIASRYYHLTHGKARCIERHEMAARDQSRNQWFPVAQWDYHESQPGGRLYYENATHISRLGGKAYLFRPTLWTYDDGLLVFAPRGPVPGPVRSDPGEGKKADYPLVVLDVESGVRNPVPFDCTDRIIRNVRLKEHTLIIEWAEKHPFHALNDSEKVHRHFATCFDVELPSSASPVTSSTSSPPAAPTCIFRSEWKIHFLGLPLNHRDRFFSTNTAHHYAVYFWQPNRSMYTGDEERPIESLHIWDISSPSSYLPSSDPTGTSKPQSPPQSSRVSMTGASRIAIPALTDMSTDGPHRILRLPYPALSHLSIRQYSRVSLISFSLSSSLPDPLPSNLDPHRPPSPTPIATLTWHESTWTSGQGYFDPAERLWSLRTTTFPITGTSGLFAPAHVVTHVGNLKLPPYRGHVTMESAVLAYSNSNARRIGGIFGVDGDGGGYGEQDSDGYDDEVEKWFIPVMDVVDSAAGVRMSLVETCFGGLGVDNRLMIRVKVKGEKGRRVWTKGGRSGSGYDEMAGWIAMDDKLVEQVAWMGRIAGDERWIVGQNRGMEIVVLKF